MPGTAVAAGAATVVAGIATHFFLAFLASAAAPAASKAATAMASINPRDMVM
jgi:hypothetical protein